MWLLRSAAVVFALTAATAHAGDGIQVTAVPIPWLVQGEAAGAWGDPILADSTAVVDSLVYSNTDYSAGFIHSSGEGVQFADDIHLTLPGRLTQIFFFFVEPEPHPVSFELALYGNDAADTGVGDLLWTHTTGLIRYGAYRVHVSVRDTVQLGSDAWFAVKVLSPSAGLVLADPPFVGMSHDLYYDWGLGDIGYFAGAAANFYLRVFVEPEPLPVEPTSWTAVKALFRPSAPTLVERR